MSTKLSITLLTLVVFFVLGFSISANAKPIQTEGVNTPDVNAMTMPGVDFAILPDVDVATMPAVEVIKNAPQPPISNEGIH